MDSPSETVRLHYLILIILVSGKHLLFFSFVCLFLRDSLKYLERHHSYPLQVECVDLVASSGEVINCNQFNTSASVPQPIGEPTIIA